MQNNRGVLTHLQQAGIVSPEQSQRLAQHGSPWWLQLLLGFAAWIASLLIISSFVGPLLALADNDVVRLFAAVVLLGTALWLATQQHDFVQQMSVAIALAGNGLMVYALYELSDNNHELARYACALISSILLFSRLNALHRRVSLTLAMLCLLSLIQSAALLAVLSNLLATLAVMLWCSRPRWVSLAYASRIKSLLEVTTLAALGLTLLGQCLFVFDSSNWLDNKLELGRALYSALGSILLISTVFWLSRLATVPSRLALLTTATLLCIVLYPASGLLVSLALMLACFYGCSKRWAGLCLLSMLFALSQFYYSLELTLLYKSGLLALSGLLVLAGWLLLQRYQRRLV
ncbi:DUF4401 domain-containing protein [Rheinheimera maricola]|uniref:DUF4401 domain-containing protein n=1 Tax=Rheinheimera maricola TaxID=2793282 RepID=A0ABS7X812_9GAMM|nr:DUF4401 domain-containing protein [Rheinheimera maricola]MBZ9611300.1 DUF4401 domain-containing protein [Rheinheimera maricola]